LNLTIIKLIPLKKTLLVIGIIVIMLLSISGLKYLSYWNLLPKKAYTAQDFGIQTVLSHVDYDGDGIDDYTDILLGARADARLRPKYKSAYYAGGYPPANEGVCTDLIWRAFANAGYSLKDLIDADIAVNVDQYPRVIAQGRPDPNIDFRRVSNLKIFFERNATSLTLDPYIIEEWQPGDIVTYSGHIAIVSDKRNKHGLPYIIHHGNQPVREEDALTRQVITGHFRFDMRDNN